jgi:hypothetical protein
MKGEIFAAQIEGIMTRKDRTLKITVGTQEMNPNKAAQMLGYMNKVVSIYICESSIDNSEIEQVDKIDPEFKGKTQSKRIRDVLYILWKQGSEGYKTFEAYYQAKTELFIDTLKSNILEP